MERAVTRSSPVVRLIKKHDLRVCAKTPCQSNPFFHSSTQLSRIFVFYTGQAYLLQFMEDFSRIFLSPYGSFPGGEGHVLEHIYGIKKGASLKEKTGSSPQPFQCRAPALGDILTVNKNIPRPVS